MLLITCFIFGLLGSLTWAGPRERTVCPSGTFAYKDGNQWYCYKFYENRLTFYEAEAECQFKWKGYLASLTKNNQVRSIGAYVTKENLKRDLVWIGLHRVQDDESSLQIGWSWTDGTLSTYKRWSYDEPKMLSYDESCVSLSPASGHLKWVVAGCDRKFPFLCKWKPS